MLRTRVLNFTPSWFSVNMGTGVVSILLHELPFQFRGLGIIANIIFALNVVLFVLFLLATLARYLCFRNMLRLMLLHPAQSLFTGTFPMGLGTIVNMIVLSLVPAWGAQWAYVAWALWMVQSIVSLLTCIGLPFLQFTRHELAFSTMAGTWLLPIVAPVVSAASGSVVASVLPPAHARFTLIVAYILWGTAVPTSLLVFGILWARLAIHKIPPGSLSVSAFLPVGPCGLGGFSIMNLAAVQRHLALRGEAALGGASLYDAREQLMFADAVYAGSIVLALIMWGFGFVWLTLAIGSVVRVAGVRAPSPALTTPQCDMAYIEGGLAFNMGWWGLVFPLGVFALSTNKLSAELDSGALRVLATILTVAVLLLWLLCLSLTSYKAATGELFHSPCLAAVGGEPPSSIGPS
ncbi:C4-dicarboxylate transporter/malic acid transport protein, partial [Tilletiopsis washingtonensis]